MSHLTTGEYLKRLLLTMLVVVIALALWQAAGIFLLTFAGVMLAIFLRTLAEFASRHSPLSPQWSLAAVIVSILLLVGGGGWLLAPGLITQTAQLTKEVPLAIERLQEQLASSSWGRTILTQLPFLEQQPEAGEASATAELPYSRIDLLSRFTRTATSLSNIIANLIFFLFVGLFLAAGARSYRNGLIRLFPPDKQQRAREVMAEVGTTLQLWLLSKTISMVIVGLLTMVGLWILGVPFALTLGLLAGIGVLVPIVGPLVTSIPAVLLAFVEGPTLALYVALLYILIQMIESNVIMPIIDEETVSVPPALTLIAVFVMGVLFGFLGMLVATPLLAAGLVTVKMIYLHDELDESIELPSGEREESGRSDREVEAR